MEMLTGPNLALTLFFFNFWAIDACNAGSKKIFFFNLITARALSCSVI